MTSRSERLRRLIVRAAASTLVAVFVHRHDTAAVRTDPEHH
jgi:hypothetical protein